MAKKQIAPNRTPAEIVADSPHLGAHFSPDGKHRLGLWRRWKASRPMCTFIGLNPSTANGHTNDPTITRVVDFAYRWDYGGLFMCNLYSLIDPNPDGLLMDLPYVCGPGFDDWAKYMLNNTGLIVAAWGSWEHLDGIRQRREYFKSIAPLPIYCLGLNKDGEPKHPLYLKKTTQLILL